MNIYKILYTLAILILLVWLIAFFAGSETAYLSMTNIRVRRMLRAKKPGAKKIAALHKDMDSLLTVVLIGINFINTLASSIATALAIELVGDSGVGIATAAITFFVTVFGEIVPKTVAGLGDNTERIAANHANALMLLKKIIFPVVWLFSSVSRGTAFAVEKIWKSQDTIITEEELHNLIEEGEHDGSLEKDERNMLNKILEISDLDVHNIMKHRSLVTYLNTADSREEVIKAFKNSGYSHLPVYRNSKENIAGILYYKDVLFAKNNHETFSVETFMKPPLFIPETFSVIELIQAFKRENRSFAVALDEQGCTAGIVTIDDVLRGLFGRMSDTDYHHHEIPAEDRIKIISPKEFLVPGDMKLVDINSILNLKLQSEEYDTLGGWLMEKFDALPSTGEALQNEGTLFAVEDQSQRRIRVVRIRR